MPPPQARTEVALKCAALWLNKMDWRSLAPTRTMTRFKPQQTSIDPGPRVLSEPLARERLQLFELEPGATRARPVEVSFAAVIEPRAESTRCPRCSGRFEVEEHEAHSSAHSRVRELKVRCRFCGDRRSLWFRINAPS